MRAPRLLMILMLSASLTHAPAGSHEAHWPSAQVVMREDGLCTLSLHLDLARTLRLTLQPQMPMVEFLAMASAQTPAQFAREWARLTARWSREVVLHSGSIRREAQRWRWPAADDAQALLRQQLMQGLTGADPSDPAPTLIAAQAEFTLQPPKPSAPVDRSALGLTLPSAFRPLSLTSYRAHQQWIRPGDDPIALKF